MPWPDNFLFRQHTALGTKAVIIRRAQMRNRPRGKDERQRVEDERPFVANGNHRGAEECADRQCHPLGGLRQRVGSVNFFCICDCRQNGRTSRGKERRGDHQQRAEQI